MIWRTMWNWIYPMIVGVLLALSVQHWVVSAAVVPSPSMEPTIPDPCYIFVNKLSTEFSNPHRGEVVLFHFPDNPSTIFVKRVIGLPGDTITVRKNALFVNGKRYNVVHAIQPNVGGAGTYHVPAGHYFMMGDNRPVSYDSRFWKNKYVARTAIIGKAEFVIYPFSKVGPIS